MDFRVTGYDSEALDELVATTAADYRDMQMEEQASLLEEEYARFKEIRDMLAWALEAGLLRPGTQLSPAMLHAAIKAVEKASESTERKRIKDDTQQCIGFMMKHGLLRPSTVIPMEKLPDLFMACPVWYNATTGYPVRQIEGEVSDEEEEAQSRSRSLWEASDPQTHSSTMWFCDRFESTAWCDVFQMFNRRFRTLKRYRGDMIPPNVMRTIRAAREVFDWVVIMTPYHDVAGRDWEDLEWIRSIDPYVVGFKRGIESMFVLARFSDTGVFPLHSELVGDTIQFLRQNRSKLAGFDTGRSWFWYSNAAHYNGKRQYVHGKTCVWRFRTKMGSQPSVKLGAHLMTVVDDLLLAFEAGKLFDWLRGDWTPAPQIEQDDSGHGGGDVEVSIDG